MKFFKLLNNYFGSRSTRRFEVGFLFSMMLVVGQAAQGQSLKFKGAVTYPAGAPFVISSADFNGDGKVDLVAGDVEHNDLVMLLGNGDGTLQPAVTFHLNAAPWEIVAADFNRDGKPDLATANSSPGTSISIRFGKGTSFDPPVNYAVGVRHLIAGDFNSDGWPDLAGIANSGVYVFLNDRKGSLQAPQFYSLTLSAVVLAVPDVNRDGKIDLVTVSRYDSSSSLHQRTISVMMGNGDGTFKAPISTVGNWGLGTGPYGIAVGDFDRDGKVDFAAADEYLTLLKGNGDGTFKALSSQPHLRNTSTDVKTVDFNGDGKLDLVVTGVFGTGALQVLLGNGDATFADAGNLINGNTSVSVVSTDLNRDTRPDLVANIDGKLAVALVNVTPGNVEHTDYFVHQHYLDFLDREPDSNGFMFWGDQIDSCGTDQQCTEVKRINVSASFYLSIEFQRTGYLVERLYKTAYGDATGTSTVGGPHQIVAPVVRRDEFLLDTQQIGEGVVVGEGDWNALLDSNKQNFISQFVQRERFAAAYPTAMTPADFVDRLNANAGNVLSASERTAAITLFSGSADTSNLDARAGVLRQVTEDEDLYNAEFNRAFVLSEYFGYLRRNPNEGPDSDYSGYDFWLNKLNQFNGNFVAAEMVKAFISSSEYRNRFTP
jgi:FG-GAP-like repeat